LFGGINRFLSLGLGVTDRNAYWVGEAYPYALESLTTTNVHVGGGIGIPGGIMRFLKP